MFVSKISLLTKYLNRYNHSDVFFIEMVILLEGDALERLHKTLVHGPGGRIICSQMKNQFTLVEAMQKNDVVFAIDPVDTGKAYTGVSLVVKDLKKNNLLCIVLTRTAVETGKNFGFLPGNLKEKSNPYLPPFRIPFAI